MPVVLVGIAILTEVLVAIACLYLVFYIIHGLFLLLNRIPGFSAIFGGLELSIEHAINSAIGSAVHTAQEVVGVAWHHLARYTDRVWNSIVTGQSVNATAAKVAEVHAGAITKLGSRLNHFQTYQATHAARVGTLERELKGIEGEIKTLKREVGKGIGHDLRIHIKALEREVDNINTQTVPSLRAKDGTLTGELSNLYDWAKGKASLLGVGTFAFAVAAAIGLNAWNMIRCAGFGNFWNNRKCGLWSDLESLLGLFADTFLLTNICDLLPFLETAVSDVADPIVVTLTDVGAGLCSGGIGPAPILQVPALSLPANPGVTLNLP